MKTVIPIAERLVRRRMPDKKRPKTDSPAVNKRVKGEKKEEVCRLKSHCIL